MKPIYALVSVSDKSKLELLIYLTRLGVKLISTGGTANTLRELGFEVIDISDFTGMEEMMNGRIKTLHPKVCGGILTQRDRSDDMADADKHDMPHISFVICNFYPFKDKPSIENIDIGGPTMVRGAAKNYMHETVLTDPGDYLKLAGLLNHLGITSFEDYQAASIMFRYELAAKAMRHTADYDKMIADWMAQNAPRDWL